MGELATQRETYRYTQTSAVLSPSQMHYALWMSIVMQLLSLFIQIDYQTFLTLSDEDLKEVGVSTFGARRKMLLAISGEGLMSQLGFRAASPSAVVVGCRWPPLARIINLFILRFQTWTRARGGSRTRLPWSPDTWRVALVVDCHESWI